MCALAMKEREYIARMTGAPFMLSEEFRECVDRYHKKVQFARYPHAVKLRQRYGIPEPAK